MPELPDSLIDLLLAGKVKRHDVVDLLKLKALVSVTLLRQAKRMTPPHVVERQDAGQPKLVSYHLRPAAPGEDIREIIDL